MTDQPWTIKRLLEWTTEFFKSKEIEQPRLGAEILLAEALNGERIELYTQFDRVPEESVLSLFRDWVKRHAKGEPVAYLVGYKEFYSLRFKVDSNVLIPRPETEHLIVAALEAAKLIDSTKPKIVDVGTGSGCIAITLACQIESCDITGVDISEEALKVARENSKIHEVDSKVKWIKGNILSELTANREIDLIVSNPPYIGLKEKEDLDHSVLGFEPNIALFGGEDGLEVIRPLIQDSAKYLKTGGFLIFESSPIVFDRCVELINASHHFSEPDIFKDLAGHRRVIQTRRVESDLL